jgi:hypothetical protein
MTISDVSLLMSFNRNKRHRDRREAGLLSGNAIAFTQMNTSHCRSIYHPIDNRIWIPSPEFGASWEQNMLVNQKLFRWVRALRKQLTRCARRINGSYSNKEDDICANVTGNTEAVGLLPWIHSNRWVRCRITTPALINAISVDSWSCETLEKTDPVKRNLNKSTHIASRSCIHLSPRGSLLTSNNWW